MSLSLFTTIANHHRHAATDTLYHAVQFCSAYYSQHDVLAFVVLSNPELIALQSGRVRVAVDGLAQGQTMMRRKNVVYPQHGWRDDIPHTQACR